MDGCFVHDSCSTCTLPYCLRNFLPEERYDAIRNFAATHPEYTQQQVADYFCVDRVLVNRILRGTLKSLKRL